MTKITKIANYILLTLYTIIIITIIIILNWISIIAHIISYIILSPYYYYYKIKVADLDELEIKILDRLNCNTNTNIVVIRYNTKVYDINLHSIVIRNVSNVSNVGNLICLHGDNSNALSAFNSIIEPTINNFNEIHLIDLPGFGRTKYNTNTYNTVKLITNLVNYIVKYIITYDIKNITLVGHSLGAYLIMYIIDKLNRMNQIDRIVNTVMIAPVGIFSFLGNYGPYFGVLFKLGITTTLFKMIPTILLNTRNFSNIDLLYDLLCMKYSNRCNNLVSGLITLNMANVRWNKPAYYLFKKINVPVTLIFGSNDTIIPVSIGIMLSELFNIPLNIVEDTWHNIAATKPNEVAKLINESLQNYKIPTVLNYNLELEILKNNLV